MDLLRRDYPWTSSPLIANGPMRLIALAPLAWEVSRAGGLGFIGAGSDVSDLASMLDEISTLHAQYKDPNTDLSLPTAHPHTLPVGVGFLLWAGEPLLAAALPLLQRYRPAAVWLYAHREVGEARRWAEEVRRVTGNVTRVWMQVGTVAEAVEAVREVAPDVLVVQGQDAGGHGLVKGAGLLPLLPEVEDALVVEVQAGGGAEGGRRMPVLVAAGGIVEGRGAAAALALGAKGIVMGTRYLAAPEAEMPRGYREAVLEAKDGGVNTERGKLYDRLRGTTAWPERYGGRGVLNDSWWDHEKGMSFEENQRLYEEAVAKGDEGWGAKARLTTYAGSGVGLTREVQPAAEITTEVREEAWKYLQRASGQARE